MVDMTQTPDPQRRARNLAYVRQLEDELICHSLLGWSPAGPSGLLPWEVPGDAGFAATPDFDTWLGAGLILEALSASGARWHLTYAKSKARFIFALGPSVSPPVEDNPSWLERQEFAGQQAIRAAVLDYLKYKGTP